MKSSYCLSVMHIFHTFGGTVVIWSADHYEINSDCVCVCLFVCLFFLGGVTISNHIENTAVYHSVEVCAYIYDDLGMKVCCPLFSSSSTTSPPPFQSDCVCIYVRVLFSYVHMKANFTF